MNSTIFFQNFFSIFDNPIFYFWVLLGKTAIWWFPFVAVYFMWLFYTAYIHARWISNLKTVLLEIKLPKEILKSPKAMEVILAQMHQPTEGSLIEQYIDGRVRSWFSLEMASFGGEIHFFIRAEAKFKNLVESQIYSQYPGVEIIDADDYTRRIPYGLPGNDWDFFGVEYKLSKPDVYPIKTYIDYGLDKDPKEEFKVDPMTAVIEFLGSIGPGQQIWMQIGILAARDRYAKPGTWFGKQSWKDAGKAEIKKIMGEDKEKNQFGAWSLSPGEREKLEAVERSMNKYGFEVGYRAMYWGKGDSFVGANIGRMLNCNKQYGSENLNGFKLGKFTSFDYPWQDFKGKRLAYRKRRMFREYQSRAFFFPPGSCPVFILNTEEVATIYHFPGNVATTPTLERIASKRGEPPANLPI